MIKLRLIGECYGKSNNIIINKGITILMGNNGCGKSYACQQIRDYLRENNKEVYYTDVYTEGKNITRNYLEEGNTKAVAKYTFASEGQRVYDTFVDNHVTKLGSFVKKLIGNNKKEGFIIIDGVDSGVSIDMILNLKDLFKMIEKDCIDNNIDIYIILTSNSFELCKYYDCIWIPTMEHYKYGDETSGYNLWRKKYEKVYKQRNS